MRRRARDVLLGIVIGLAAVGVVGVIVWRQHPRRRFDRTLRQIRSLPERRERTRL